MNIHACGHMADDRVCGVCCVGGTVRNRGLGTMKDFKDDIDNALDKGQIDPQAISEMWSEFRKWSNQIMNMRPEIRDAENVGQKADDLIMALRRSGWLPAQPEIVDMSTIPTITNGERMAIEAGIAELELRINALPVGGNLKVALVREKRK